MSSPLITMVPVVGVSNPAIMRSVVVLPQPLGPRNETNSPRGTSRLKSSTAAVSLKVLEMSVSVRNDMAAVRP